MASHRAVFLSIIFLSILFLYVNGNSNANNFTATESSPEHESVTHLEVLPPAPLPSIAIGLTSPTVFVLFLIVFATMTLI
ncbi:unnamed protein product [Lupinus luteus]|uniref:Transmembrane protein n=1 Tax=Lupinus luteus TaxID=3873 RepID=A0AAV1WNU7_LUPLU